MVSQITINLDNYISKLEDKSIIMNLLSLAQMREQSYNFTSS